MESRICSLETEYALVSNFLGENSSGRDQVADQVESVIRATHFWVKCNSFGRNARSESSQNIVQIREGQFLENGSRVYYDVGHFEWANPETIDPLSATIYEAAAELNLVEATDQVIKDLKEIQPDVWIMLVKNNVDYSENTSYGCHENYSIHRYDNRGQDIFAQLQNSLVPFLVTRQIFSGSGRIGARLSTPDDSTAFQISQRADFIEQVTSPQTRSNRSILNLRDEPLADKNQWRRLHLILGDSNMSEFSTFLKIGTTSLVLTAIESNYIHNQWALREPVLDLHRLSHNGLHSKLQLRSGDRATALTIQREYWKVIAEMVKNWPRNHFAHEIVRFWEQTLDDLEKSGERLYQRIDWAIKQRFLFDRMLKALETDWQELGYWIYVLKQTESVLPCPQNETPHSWVKQNLKTQAFRQLDDFINSHRLDWRLLFNRRELLSKLYEMDFRYHDIHPNRGLYAMLKNKAGVVEQNLLEDDAVKTAQRTPPKTTRAWQRGHIIKLSRDKQIDLEMDWDKVLLTKTNQIIPLPDPFLPDQIQMGRIFMFDQFEGRNIQSNKKVEVKIIKVENLEKH